MNSKAPSKESLLTVREAIQKGNFWVTNVSMALFLLVVVSGLIMATLDWISDKLLFCMVLLGLILSTLYWAVAITKWRIWAFTKTRNVHHLLVRSIEENILPKEDSFTKHFEYWSNQDKKKWELLKIKFEQKDVLVKSSNYPKYIKIYHDRPIVILYFTLNLFLLWLLAELIYENNMLLLAIPSFCGIAYLALGQYHKLFSTTPQITLSKKGIESVEHPLYRWTKIKNLAIEKRMVNKAQTFFLEYNTPKKFISFRLDLLNIEVDELREALRIYGHKKC